MKVGAIFKNIKLNASGCPHLVVLLSSDREPGFEIGDDIWRCAHFQICNDFLLGSQIVLFTKAELGEMEFIGYLSSMIPSPVPVGVPESPVEA